MYKEKGRKIIRFSIITAIITVMVLSCMGILLGNGGEAKAFQGASNISSQSTNLGEMLLEGYEDNAGGKVFDKEVFWQLITQITGETKPTMDTLTDLGKTEKTSANFRTLNGGKDVVVVINGIPWTATYLSQNASGDPILTLWQADAIALDYYDVSSNSMKQAVNIAWNPTNAVNSAAKYPSNSYGTSAMSTAVLNNGGAFARSNSATENVSQNANNTYAKFTMPSVKGSLTSYIEIPNNVPYQKNNTKESAKTQALHSSYKYDANNDVLGAPISGNMYDAAHTYYTNATVDNTGYLSWGDDRVWLPSFAEAGYSTDGGATSGLWKTSTNQRSTSTSVSVSGTANSVSYSWLRSAC